MIDLDSPTAIPRPLNESGPKSLEPGQEAIEHLIDSLDANAEALRRAALARRLFYGGLKKKLPQVSVS